MSFNHSNVKAITEMYEFKCLNVVMAFKFIHLSADIQHLMCADLALGS